jgi:hypothetical protein
MSRWPTGLSPLPRKPVIRMKPRRAKPSPPPREPVLRPAGAPASFMCSSCRLVLYDGPDYSWCPTCSALVDWIELDRPWSPPPPHSGSSSVSGMAQIGLSALTLACLGLLVTLALDPLGFAFVAPLLLVAVIAAGYLLVAVAASLGELWDLARDHRTRVIHGLEHACIKLLERQGRKVIAGQTHLGFFELTIVNDGRASAVAVEQATTEAIARIAAGERSLALHRRCGTSLIVGAVTVSALILTATVVGVIEGVPRGPLILGTAVAALLVWRGSRTLGLLAQRAATVSTAFAAALVHRIVRVADASGDTATFLVHLHVFETPPPCLGADRFAVAHRRGFPAPALALPRIDDLPPAAASSAFAPPPLDLGAVRFTLAQPRGFQPSLSLE